MSKTINNLVTFKFESYEAMQKTGIVWRSWTPPGHPGYSTAGRALASMTRKGIGEHWGAQDGKERRKTQRLCAYYSKLNHRWHPMYEI